VECPSPRVGASVWCGLCALAGGPRRGEGRCTLLGGHICPFVTIFALSGPAGAFCLRKVIRTRISALWNGPGWRQRGGRASGGGLARRRRRGWILEVRRFARAGTGRITGASSRPHVCRRVLDWGCRLVRLARAGSCEAAKAQHVIRTRISALWNGPGWRQRGGRASGGGLARRRRRGWILEVRRFARAGTGRITRASSRPHVCRRVLDWGCRLVRLARAGSCEAAKAQHVIRTRISALWNGPGWRQRGGRGG
jgi:hypothetical protein